VVRVRWGVQTFIVDSSPIGTSVTSADRLLPPAYDPNLGRSANNLTTGAFAGERRHRDGNIREGRRRRAGWGRVG
jgi:hypothetical protein